MKAWVVVSTLLISVSACSSGSDGGTKAADPLCRFAAPPLTSAAQARQMAADLKTALGPGNPVKVSNLAVSKAALALELAAGQVVPSGEAGVPDPGLAQANTAQATLASACS